MQEKDERRNNQHVEAYSSPIKKNVVFVHIPKTAGSSIRQMFRAAHGDDGVSLSTDQGSIIKDMESGKFEYFFGHVGAAFALNYSTQHDAVVFSFLRNPIDRIISLYSFFHELDPSIYGADFAIKTAIECDVDDFIQNKDPRIVSYLDNTQVWQLAIAADQVTRFQFRYLSNDDLIRLALSNLKKFQFVGIVEKMEESSEQLSKILEMNLNIQHVNKSNRKYIPKQIETQKLLDRYIKLDLALYNHISNNESQKNGFHDINFVLSSAL